MMKNTIFILITTTSLLAFFSQCDKDDENLTTLIEYPDTGFYGSNILNLSDTLLLCDKGPDCGDGEYYSMKAILNCLDSKLKVEISGSRLAVYNNQGWYTNFCIYRYDNYIFKAEHYISADLQIHFCGEGEVTIKIFENNDSVPNRIKKVYLVE